MPMAGGAEEYEKMALASLRRASEQGGDSRFHHGRAQIFAMLALAAATEASPAVQATEASPAVQATEAGPAVQATEAREQQEHT
jgi:hypothetical protein